MPGQDSAMEKATAALKRENDRREAEFKKNDTEEADLRRMIRELQNFLYSYKFSTNFK